MIHPDKHVRTLLWWTLG